jgi:hypothetical protein
MTDADRAPPDQTHRWHDLVDLLTEIRGRAQATRHRIGRVRRLSRAHIAADLAQIEAATDELLEVLAEQRGAASLGAQAGSEEAAMGERNRLRIADAVPVSETAESDHGRGDPT